MNRRLVSAVAAGVLAVLGAVLLITYVNNADERAMENMEPIEVIVVSAPIAQGTPAEAIAESVTTEQLPRASVGPDRVRSLTEISGRVAATDLRPGEQLLAGRFTTPQALVEFGGIPVPDGHHQVTIPLDASRVVGGAVTAGDRVGIFLTLGDTTHLLLHKILVTRVQGGLAQAEPTEGTRDPDAAPEAEGGAMVTFALNAHDAETVVYAIEHGGVWLSIEDDTASEDGTRRVNSGNVYE